MYNYTHMQVLLDPSTMKGSNKEWKDLKKQLDNAGKLKVEPRLPKLFVFACICFKFQYRITSTLGPPKLNTQLV